jgi:N-acylneuraminate cytidylyltransferase
MPEVRTYEHYIAVIPARGGSKGIPGKNLKEISGHSLVGWSILTARDAGISRILVSTDCPEITRVASSYGAEVVKRPASLSGDNASSEDALLQALEEGCKSLSIEPTRLVFLQCTSPLTNAEDLQGAIATFERENADSLVSVSRFHYFLWKKKQDQSVVGINHDAGTRLLRQQQSPQFKENGAIYIMDIDGFRTHKHRFFGHTVMYEMPGERSWEIDEEVDLEVAEVLMRRQQKIEVRCQNSFNPKALILDFDGVFTDNRVFVNQEGVESVACSRGDGMGIALMRKAGIPALVISTEVNPVVSARCKKLKIPFLQGINDKLSAMTSWLRQRSINVAEIAYLGNDINDLPCLEVAGLSVVPSDAHNDVKSVADLVLQRPGGYGAVRELCDILLKKMRK